MKLKRSRSSQLRNELMGGGQAGRTVCKGQRWEGGVTKLDNTRARRFREESVFRFRHFA